MLVDGKQYQAIWRNVSTGQVFVIDQRHLPHSFVVNELRTVDEFVFAIRDMIVRGAPLIGVTAAYGMAVAMKEDSSNDNIVLASSKLKSARPTAVNLSWAVDRVVAALDCLPPADRAGVAMDLAERMSQEDVERNIQIGRNGVALIDEVGRSKPAGEPVRILTHCNAGWLATINWGTATSPIYQAHKKGIPVHVWADETRPRNQGANLTSYELNEEGIKNTIIADNTGGILMQRGEVDMCIVGTDRTLANGDVCNKVGTYLKALAAHDNNIPFYVALPSSTIDWNIQDHKDIPIEERNSEELSHMEGLDEKGDIKKIQIYPKKSKAMNLAFDVTPAKYITGLITEKGVCEASEKGLKELFK